MGAGATTAKIEAKVVVVGEDKGKQINKKPLAKKAPIMTDSQDKNSEKVPEKLIINDGNVADSPDAKIANNKLKRLAFGQQGYMDQQRDYDQTLSKMEFNKGSQLQWSSPPPQSTLSPSSIPNMVNKSSDSAEVVVKSSLKKPPGPPPPKKFTFDTSVSNGLPATHQMIMVQPFKDPEYGMTTPVNKFSGGVNSDHLETLNLSTKSGSSITLSNNTTRSTVRPILRKPPEPSPHRNIHILPVENTSYDDEDLEMGDFSPDSTSVLTPSKRPENIPLLVISPTALSTTPKAVGNKFQSNKFGGSSATKQSYVPKIHAPPGVSVDISSAPKTEISKLPSGPKPPPTVTSVSVQSNRSNVSPAIQDSSLPVVKETNDVKRNRAQIPDMLRHAKPNTGNWLNNRYIVNNYILLDGLGTGSYGEVRLCKDRITETLYAIKIISKDFLKKRKNNKTTETYFEDIKREIAIMKKLLHPNILRLFEVLDDPNVNKMYLVLEYMKMGDLINILKRRQHDGNESSIQDVSNSNNASGFSPLSDYEVWNIFRQLTQGIKYLHMQNVVHGDIKPQNLLLGEDGVLKVADFGISHMLSASGQKLADAAGTPAFMSPELCEGKPFSGQSADIWAMGATIFMLRFGHPPFIAKNIINLYNKIVNDPLVFPYDIDPGLRNILEHLLEKDPQKRFTMQQITTHPWLRHMPLNPITVKLQKVPTTAENSLLSSSTKPMTNFDVKDMSTFHDHEKTSTSMNMLTFIPPPTYDAEEAAAMKNVITELDNNDLFMSIGGIRKQKRQANAFATNGDDSVFESVDVDDRDLEDSDDDSPPIAVKGMPKPNRPTPDTAAAAATADVKSKNNFSSANIMETNWGADVFGIIEHDSELDDDSADDDEKQTDEDRVRSFSFKESGKKRRARDSISSTVSSTSTHSQPGDRLRSEMSVEEEKRRSKRFLNKITRKSTENMHHQVAKEGIPATGPGTGLTAVAVRTKDFVDSSEEEIAVESDGQTKPGSNLLRHQSKEGSRFRVSSKYNSSTASLISREDYDEVTDHLSMDDFNKMMDTLAQQPVKRSDEDDSDDDEEKSQSSVKSFNTDSLISKIRNAKNSIGAAHYSEKGARPTQEDRCVLIANLATMTMEHHSFDSISLEALTNMSLACVFDGHNGSSCSQYLSQHFPPMLITHPKFLDRKQLDSVITEVCKNIDRQLCKMLRESDDESGSTGVIAIYDGRKHLFTVAGVGDSLCVLSRGGRAVVLNKMHRLDNETEIERIKQAGGTVLNSRVNGILAVSRAFGDTEFKGEELVAGKVAGRLLIAEPEIYSEIITPMTEFAIIATDGLWDIMSPQVAVSFVRRFLTKQRRPTLQDAVKRLTSEAVSRGSVDNVTACLIVFNINSSSSSLTTGNHQAT